MIHSAFLLLFIPRGPFITALGRTWCPTCFICNMDSCRRSLQDVGFVEEKGGLYCEDCYGRYLAPECSKCRRKIIGVSQHVNVKKKVYFGQKYIFKGIRRRFKGWVHFTPALSPLYLKSGKKEKKKKYIFFAISVLYDTKNALCLDVTSYFLNQH